MRLSITIASIIISSNIHTNEKTLFYYLATFNKIKNKVSLNTVMVNNYYDFNNQSALAPYIILGAG